MLPWSLNTPFTYQTSSFLFSSISIILIISSSITSQSPNICGGVATPLPRLFFSASFYPFLSPLLFLYVTPPLILSVNLNTSVHFPCSLYPHTPMSSVIRSHHWLLCIHTATVGSVPNTTSMGEVIVCSTHPKIRRYHGGKGGVKIPYGDPHPSPLEIQQAMPSFLLFSRRLSWPPPPRKSGLIDHSIVCVLLMASPHTGCNENLRRMRRWSPKYGTMGHQKWKIMPSPPLLFHIFCWRPGWWCRWRYPSNLLLALKRCVKILPPPLPSRQRWCPQDTTRKSIRNYGKA